MLNTPIPKIEFPSIDIYHIANLDEPLVSLQEAGFLCDSQYYQQGLKGSLSDCYARKSVVGMLKVAESYLPDGLKFKIYDAYRPIQVQQSLWDSFRAKQIEEHPNASEEEIDRFTGFFVSKPSYDETKPSLHNTGGAVDLTLVTNNGYALNMGTLFDDFSNRAWTNHFEEHEHCLEAQENRRILYNAMIKAGFTNLPSEWWHYDFGTKFWGYFKHRDALYHGILKSDFPGDAEV